MDYGIGDNFFDEDDVNAAVRDLIDEYYCETCDPIEYDNESEYDDIDFSERALEVGRLCDDIEILPSDEICNGQEETLNDLQKCISFR